MDIVVLFPQGRISHIQELQMTSVAAVEPNVWAWFVPVSELGRMLCMTQPPYDRACEGTSDDLDRPIAALFLDVEFRHKHSLGSLNSVNVARVLVQSVHYFLAYFAATADAEEPVRKE